jgi:hypothetical protein
MFMARGLLLTLSFTSPQSAGQPPKGSTQGAGSYIGCMVSDSVVGVLRLIMALIHNDRHAGAIDHQYDDCAKRSVTKHNSGGVSVALKF